MASDGAVCNGNYVETFTANASGGHREGGLEDCFQ